MTAREEDVRGEGRDDDSESAGQGEPSRDGGRRRSFLGELPFLVLVALGLALVLKAFVIQAFYIPSGSMEATLQVGDRVLVNKVVYRLRDIARGDVVVFNGLDSFAPEVVVQEPTNPVARVARRTAAAVGFAPAGERDFIKRVIGVPGDRVKCCDAQGRISVNGVPLDELYLYADDPPSGITFDVEVPQERLWVMGDHRSASADSRSHLGDPGGGTVPADRVIGRAFVVVWPFGRTGLLPIPDTFDRPGLAAAQAETGTARSAPPLDPAYGLALLVPLPVGFWLRRQRTR